MPPALPLALEQALRATLRGSLHCDAVSRAIYAVDASIYQQLALGVVAPADEGDVLATLRLARAHGVPLIARGGATSLAGQTVGAALHLDMARALTRVRELDPTTQTVRVQPGITLADLNLALQPAGLLFAPDVSPANRATIGGMIGNNSCGMYSLIHGKTIDHVRGLKAVLSDGTLLETGPLTSAAYARKLAQPGREGTIYRELRALLEPLRAQIAARFPPLLRRVGGYNLDRLVGPEPPDLTALLVGSEGTLALTLEATLGLVPRPAQRGICTLHFPTVAAAVDAVPAILEQQPAAVELMDALLLELTARAPQYAAALATFAADTPGAVLLVEFQTADSAALQERLDAFMAVMQAARIGTRAQLARTPAELTAIATVRAASQPLLMALAPDRKPQTCIEDSAVPPEHLGAYVRQLQALLQREGVRASFYGHASVGLLHVRPLLNLNDPADVRRMRRLSEAVCELVLEHGGAVSGEHGDGLLRSEFNARIYGPELYAAFEAIKRLFDPLHLLNPGKITAAPPLDQSLRPAPLPAPPSAYRFAASGGMVAMVELCNSNGMCRKLRGGTMCPSFRATRDEAHATRGRANALRAVFNGTLPATALVSDALHTVLDLCLECKACSSECPSGVDMARLKSEVLYQRGQQRGVPLRTRLLTALRPLFRYGAPLAPLLRAANALPGRRWLQERLGVAAARTLPLPARQNLYAWWRAQRPPDYARSVVLFPDTWTAFGEPWIAQAAVRSLWAAGYSVVLPTRPICCGRPLLSKGLLDQARRLIAQQSAWLAPYAAAGLPIIGLEPSCILAFRDEYPDLVDTPEVRLLAGQARTFEEFVAAELQAERWPRPSAQLPEALVVHQHCHARALTSGAALEQTLAPVAQQPPVFLDAGCCGMAGAFGYEREHYALSVQIANDALLPALNAAPDALVVAPGTSCRQQIAHLTGRTALHPAELWQRVLVERCATR